MNKTKPQEQNTVPFQRRLRTKLIASFLVPVFCIILLGSVSYKQASNAIIANYENTANQTMEMTNQYLSLVIETVRSTYSSYINDEDMTKYFKGQMDETTARGYASTTSKAFSRDAKTNTLVANIYFISDAQAAVTSGNPADSDIYAAYTASAEGAEVSKDRTSFFLFGNQSEADGTLGTDDSQYSMRLAKHMNYGNTIMLVDFEKSMLTDALSSMYAGEGSYVALITDDGTEFYSDGLSGKDFFSNKDFYQDAAASGESGMKYVTCDGEQYLFLYSPLSVHNVMLCSLIPKSTIVAQASGIETLALVLVIFACLVAAGLGWLLSAHINSNISHILGQLKKIASGDLTSQIRTKSTDEFKLLAEGVNSMTDSMKKLITNVTSASDALGVAASQVSASSDTFMTTSEDIRGAISEIETGVTQLDENSANCLRQMDTLSGKIESVTSDAEQITVLTESTSGSIQSGIHSMNVLTDSAKKTSAITDNVITAIENLSEKSRSIGQIVESINSIARETNLLSLNASIEAARAGESGRGFAVVAEQIRQLADQSAASAGQIQHIIEDIIQNTHDVVNIAKEAEATVEFQEQAVTQTTDAFLSMDKQIHTLIDSIAGISENVRNMEEARHTTLNAIEGISTISAQTAAGSSNVNATVSSQRDAINMLNAAATNLQARSSELTEILHQFIL